MKDKNLEKFNQLLEGLKQMAYDFEIDINEIRMVEGELRKARREGQAFARKK